MGKGEVVDDDAGGDGDVEGVLGAVLGYLQAAVAEVDDFLMDTLHLVAQNDGIALTGKGTELMEHGAALSLLY